MKQGWKIGQTTNGVELVEVVANADEGVVSKETVRESHRRYFGDKSKARKRAPKKT